MTSGKRAKAERRAARQLATTTPRDPATPKPMSFQQAGHALGPAAGAYVAWQEHMKAGLLRIMEENRKALDACTGDVDCQQSIHHPGCWAVR